MIAPQTTGPFQPANWNFPGIALKGDDAQQLAAILDQYAELLADTWPHDKQQRLIALTRINQAREFAKIFRSCWKS